MSDVVNEAAQVLVPLLAVGASTAMEAAATEAGKEFAQVAGSVVGRIRKLLRGAPKAPEVAAALHTCVDDGTIRLADLEKIVRLSKHRVGPTNTTIAGDVKNMLTDPVFNDKVIFE
jgi:hypothetical protein